MAQWLRIHPPVQGTRVRSLVREDPACCGATARAPQLLSPCATTVEPTRCNYWSPCALGPICRNYWARVLQLLKPVRLEPMLRNKRSCRSEKPAHHNQEWPLLTATRESQCAAMKTQCSKNKPNKQKTSIMTRPSFCSRKESGTFHFLLCFGYFLCSGNPL